MRLINLVKMLPKSETVIFLLYRLTSVFVIQTSYVPDEYWQSLEVAHRMVFGYGYLTWEWKYGLRSYIYPSAIALLYKLLEMAKLDSQYAVVVIPRFAQALLSALSDNYFYHLCLKIGCKPFWIKAFLLTNWFWYFCGSRTIVNMLETSMTIIALYYYPWNIFKVKLSNRQLYVNTMWNYIINQSLKYIPVVILNCLIRPTAVTIWGPLIMYQLVILHPSKITYFIFSVLLPMAIALCFLTFSIDYFWYEYLVFPPLNFIMSNIFFNIASFYGTNPFHWYITQGIPAVLGLHVIPFVAAIFSLLRNWVKTFHQKLDITCGVLLVVIIINLFIFSMIEHKEFRFILPLLPMMEIIVIKYVSNLKSLNSRQEIAKLCTSILIIGFICLSVLFGMFHQKGTISVMNYLSEEAHKNPQNTSVLFLMPCHSTPLYSHLHINVPVRFLLCDPPLIPNHKDESEEFFNDPQKWLESKWHTLGYVSHVICFDSLVESINDLLTARGFILKQKFIHTIIRGSSAGNTVFVYER